MQNQYAAGQSEGTCARTVLVTGSTDGIGAHTACNLASRGWRVYVHGRDSARGAAALDAVRRVATGPSPELFVADLSRCSEVKRLIAEVSRACESHGGGLDVLVNNAGVFEHTRRKAEGGVEMTLAVNVLSVFMLCTELWPFLARASAHAGRARIVNVSSISHMDGGPSRPGGTIEWDNVQCERDYDGYAAYGLSKLLVIMTTYSLAVGECDGVGGGAVDVLTLDPGTVNTKMLLSGWGPCGIPVGSADDETWAATSPDAISGHYYVGRRSRRSAECTYDADCRRRIWAILSNLVAAWCRSVEMT
jgi:NAD(P)-dependent dehydrogenase (short-subunit alcohol dehydrogenase family)